MASTRSLTGVVRVLRLGAEHGGVRARERDAVLQVHRRVDVRVLAQVLVGRRDVVPRQELVHCARRLAVEVAAEDHRQIAQQRDALDLCSSGAAYRWSQNSSKSRASTQISTRLLGQGVRLPELHVRKLWVGEDVNVRDAEQRAGLGLTNCRAQNRCQSVRIASHIELTTARIHAPTSWLAGTASKIAICPTLSRVKRCRIFEIVTWKACHASRTKGK